MLGGTLRGVGARVGALDPAGILTPAWARFATKKTSGTGGQGKTSNAKSRGMKIFGDQFAKAGAIIVRQVGLKFRPGENVGIGRDFTLFAKAAGFVEFTRKRHPGPSTKPKTWIHVRAHSKEEHMERVRQRVAKRNLPKDGAWTRLQRGDFAHLNAPKEARSAQ